MTDIQLWNVCRAIAGDVRHMPSKRAHTVVLSDRGTELASKTEITTRGKVTQTLYVFTAAGRKRGEPADIAIAHEVKS